MSNIYHLYVKTHNITGLKYLGKTIKDPFKYSGSGIYWKRHLEEHGYNVSTEILGSYTTKESFKVAGLYYSSLWNIVESTEWANLKVEEGDGGSDHKPMLGKHFSIESRQKMSESQKKLYKNGYINPSSGRSKSQESKDKISNTLKQKYSSGQLINPNKGVQMSIEQKEKISKSKLERNALKKKIILI